MYEETGIVIGKLIYKLERSPTGRREEHCKKRTWHTRPAFIIGLLSNKQTDFFDSKTRFATQQQTTVLTSVLIVKRARRCPHLST